MEKNSNGRSAAVLAVVSVALLLAGCGGGDSTDSSSASTTDVTVADGLVITVPSDLGSQEPKEAILAVLDAVAEKVGFTSEWKTCVGDGIDEIPDSKLQSLDAMSEEEVSQTALQFSAQLGASCGKTVDLVVSPDATPEQIDALRSLTASQLEGYAGGARLTPAQVGCMSDKYEALPDDKVVEFANASTQRSAQLILGLIQICAKA